ncbi:hypothetical protein NQ318_015607 [Aromia moschata]|uniref:Cytochrome P450 n=1 Tax=Aromia moschata TaxID=1265417 RepID=A0AAV8XSR7_9CUCU|nr:hypothetical protein NQ318_015607 [Aromia moschata]
MPLGYMLMILVMKVIPVICVIKVIKIIQLVMVIKIIKSIKTSGHQGRVYLGIQPNLVLVDPNYIKHVLTKDFRFFVNRGVYQCESDPISINIFSQLNDEWRAARVKFTNIFTSVKMKSMFQIVLNCSKPLEKVLEQYSRDNKDIDILEVMACFTTDVIGSSAFGISCNSFESSDAEFRKMGRKVFDEFSLWDQMNLFLSIYTPNLAQRLGVRNIQKDVSRFFSNPSRM